jgi:hypothetical protein
MSFAYTSQENREIKSDFVLGILVTMGRMDMLVTLILFLLGCSMLLAVAVTDDIFYLLLTTVTKS